MSGWIKYFENSEKNSKVLKFKSFKIEDDEIYVK